MLQVDWCTPFVTRRQMLMIYTHSSVVNNNNSKLNEVVDKIPFEEKQVHK